MKVTLAGRDFALTKRENGPNLPKRYVGTVELVVNGAPELVRVTDNIVYAGTRDVALQYLWIEVAGKAMYVTLDPGVLASEYAGCELDVSEGTGPKVPARAITREDGVSMDRAWTEAERLRKFRATWAKRA
jgi:hypothetical protein